MKWTYPHMCRNEHQQIGHSDSEHERCPLCRANDALHRLVYFDRELQQWRSSKHGDADVTHTVGHVLQKPERE